MRRFWLYLAFATVVGGVFLWLAARELRWDEVQKWAQTADLGHIALWSLLFAIVYAVCHAARIVRWNELVQPLGEVDPRTVHRVCVVGFTAILLLPFRLGELVRPYLLSRRTSLGMTPLLGTAVVERVIDGLVITGLLFVTLATYSGSRSAGFAQTFGLISAGIFIPALLVCLVALWQRELALTAVRRIGGLVSPRLAERIAELLEAFIEGFRGLVAKKAAGRFLLATILYWTTNVASMWMLARWGFGLDVGPWEIATVMAVLVIGIMLPAGPAMAGNFEYFALRGLGLFVVLEGEGSVGAQAAAFAALLHILQFVVIVIPGFIVMWSDREARHLVQLSQQAEQAERAA